VTVSALLDTSFLITLVNQNRPNHSTAAKYYRFMLEQQVPIYFSAIVAAEFAIKQPLSELPIKNFRCLPFNIPHSIESARLWNAIGKRDDGENRAVIRDDTKLLGQAAHESISHVVTEDESTLYKYCEKLRNARLIRVQAVKLIDGFIPAVFDGGQIGLLDDDEDSAE
jgi:hypothetical protein